jgi:hypothetical protein
MTVQVLINDATLHGAARGGVARYVRHIAGAAAMHYESRVAICSARRIAPPPSRWIPIPRFRGSGRLRAFTWNECEARTMEIFDGIAA